MDYLKRMCHINFIVQTLHFTQCDYLRGGHYYFD